MMTKASIVPNSAEQSTVSLKSDSNRKRSVIFFPTNTPYFNTKSGSPIKEVLIGLFCCTIISCSFTTAMESARLAYKTVWINNSTNSKIEPPVFMTYWVISWLVLFMPIHIVFMKIRKESKENMWESIRCTLWLLPKIQFHWCRSLMLSIILIFLWNIMIYSLMRSAKSLSGVDITTIFSINTCISYLLFWVILHKKFIAIRIVAFIVASSGVIINIYINPDLMWSKVLVTTSATAFALIVVINKHIQNLKNLKENSHTYSIIGITNSLFTWPIFILLSVMTNTENILWNEIPWVFIFGCGLGILVTFVTIEIASLLTSRFSRTFHFIFSIPMTFMVDKIWLKSDVDRSDMEFVSIVFIVIATLLNAIPYQFLKTIHHRFFPKKVRHNTARRVSLSARSHLMGNGNPILNASSNQSK